MVKKKSVKSKSKLSFKKSLKKPKISQRYLLSGLFVLAVAVFCLSGWLYWTKVLADADRVLNDSIAKNLGINSVTRHVVQADSSGGIEQTAHLSFFAPDALARSKTELTQKTSARNEAKVTTETIGTKSTDYVRYVSVDGADGLAGADNLKKLIGTWAKREADPEKGATTDFLNESLFGIVPFGRLTDDAKKQLIDKINEKDLYKYSSATREIKNLRPVYVYRMSIKTEDLVEILSEYARLTGLADPSQFNPKDYEGSPPISVDITIDVLSRNLTSVTYNATNRTEEYSGWNLYKPSDLPNDAISIEELQKRMENTSGSQG
ncbi:hypothetical protein HZB74_03340 [Candidatus Saccharibacteria bacterium]|nr:hypothetical protein [Candidatus Saccharibacteria bacterium]